MPNADEERRKIRLTSIPIDHIECDLKQPRKRFNEAELQALADSMRVEGVGNLQQAVVKPHSEKSGYYVMVAGERRLRAHKLNGDKKMWCIVREGVDDTFIASLVENTNRISLDPIEEAEAIRRLREEYKLKWREIEQMMGLTIPTLLESLNLLKLPEEIQQMIIEGVLPKTRALDLMPYLGTRSEQDLIRYACALAQKKGVPELAFRRRTDLGKQYVKRRVPETSEGQLARILRAIGGASSLKPTLDRFAKLPRETQRQMFNRSLPEDVQQEVFTQLVGLVNAFCIFIEDVDKSGSFVTIMQRSGGDGEISEGARDETPRFDDQVIGDAKQLLEFFEKRLGYKEPLFSNRDLAKLLGTGKLLERAEERALAALRCLEHNWRRSPDSHNPLKNELLVKIANIRFDLGVEMFAQFLGMLKDADCSSDPINLMIL